MAMITSYTVKKDRNSMAGFSAYENGGKGSGNFDHSGRPGQVGGSGTGTGSKSKSEKVEKDPEIQAIDDYEKTQIESVKKWQQRGDISKERADSMIKDIKRKMNKERVIRQAKPGDILEITPKDNLPNFDKKIKVDSVGEDCFRYGASEHSDGKEYPFYAIKDIKISKKKNNAERLQAVLDRVCNGGKGSGNFGHAGRPGEVGGSGNGKSGGSSKEPVGYGGLTAKGESELRELVDKYADYVTGEEMGYFSTIKPDKEEILEPEGLLSRKSEKQTKKATEIAKSIQKMAKEIVADKSLTKEQKAMLMDACGVVYSQLSSALLSGGKIRADDSFSASGVWSKLDRSDKTKTSYAKKIREMGDSVHEIYSAKETTTKRYKHSEE